MSIRPLIAAALAAVAAACGDGLDGRALWSHQAWRVDLEGEHDPWASHAAPEGCRQALFGVDTLSHPEPAVDILTGGCSYFSARQALLHDVQAGAMVELVWSHSDLVSAEPGRSGHAGLAVSGLPWWERTVSIPRTGGRFRERVTVPANAAAGSPVVLHVHNHGNNQWTFESLRIDLSGR